MSSDQGNGAPLRIHYAWIVAIVTFTVLIITAGVRATPALLMVPLEQEFGWSRTVISAAVAINIALFGLIGPFAASAMHRWGLRRLVAGAVALLAISVALTTRMQHQWQMTLLWGVCVGTGTGVTSMVLAAVVATRWFDERRGLVLGALTAANATGQLIFLPFLARLIEARGWRPAVLVVAGAAVIVFALVALFMRDRPQDLGLMPYGWKPDATSRPSVSALSPFAALSLASRSRAFWVLAGTFFVCGASTNGLIGTHLIPACHDYGIPGSALGAAAGGDGPVRYSRNHGVGMAHRSIFEPAPAVRLLHAARALAALSADRAGERCQRSRTLRDLLWARLDGDGAADGSSDRRGVRPGEHRRHLRLDQREPSDGRVAGRAGRRRDSYDAGDYRVAFWIAGVLCVLAGVSFLTITQRTFGVRQAVDALPAGSVG